MSSKVIPQTTLLGQRGVNLIERIVIDMGFLWYPTGSVEAGIDGHIELRDAASGAVLNSVIGVQSKAFDRPFANETADGFSYYCSEKDLEYWLKGNLPVILVVSRPSADEAYWVSIKDYFQHSGRGSARKVHFDKRANRFDASSREAVFQLAVSRNSGIYLAPPLLQERLISNILPVAFLPSQIFVASTQCRTPGQVWQQARDQSDGVGIGGEWVLRNNQIISFRDLRRPAWSEVCDRGTVEDLATEEWSQTEDQGRRRDFVDLLRRTLREMVRDELRYNEKLELFYFRAPPDLSAKEVAYKGMAKATERTVFKAYLADDGSVKYYRHSAFLDRFHRFDGQWYLEITPTYLFTSDGTNLRWGYERFLKKIKEIEGHEAVRGQVIMWAEYLTPRADMFTQEPYPFLGFLGPATFDTDRGIDDASWDAKRDQARNQEALPGVSDEPSTLPLFAT